MAATWQATGTAQSNTGTGALATAWPTHAAGDIGLVFVEWAGTWTPTLSSVTGSGFTDTTPAVVITGTNTNLAVFWGRATGSAMNAPQVSTGGTHKHCFMITFRGAISTGNPINASATAVKNTASTSATLPSVTPAVADSLIVLALSKEADSSAAFLTSLTNANLYPITERYDAGTTQGDGGGIAVGTASYSLTTAIGTTAAVVTSTQNAMMTLAISPEPEPAPSPSTTVFFEDFSSSISPVTWTLNAGSTKTSQSTAVSETANNAPGSAGGAMNFWRQPADTSLSTMSTTLTGLTVGVEHTLSARFKSFSASRHHDAWVGVTGIGTGAVVVTYSNTNAHYVTAKYTFTPTATSHTIDLYADATNGNTDIFVDDVKVTTPVTSGPTTISGQFFVFF